MLSSPLGRDVCVLTGGGENNSSSFFCLRHDGSPGVDRWWLPSSVGQIAVQVMMVDALVVEKG